MTRPIIVGFDPGLTSAWAALDLRGELLAREAGKQRQPGEVARAIKEAGRPLIIAVDKAKAPEAAAKLAASFSCQLWAPESDLRVDEKGKAVKEFLKEAELEQEAWTAHEKDALASALACFRSLATGFAKIEDSLSSLGMQQYSEQVKAALLTKKAKNIDEAISLLRGVSQRDGQMGKPVSGTVQKSQQMTNASASKGYREEVLERKIRGLENSIDIQKMYIAKLEGNLQELERSKKQMLDDRLKQTAEARKEFMRDKDLQLREQMVGNMRAQLSGLQKENENLKAEIERRDELQQLVDDDRVPLVIVKDWTREALAEADRIYKLREKLLWLESFKESNAALRYCLALGVRGVVASAMDDETAEKLRKAGVMVVKGLVPVRGRHWAAAEKAEFQNALRASERSGFVSWLMSYRSDRKGL